MLRIRVWCKRQPAIWKWPINQWLQQNNWHINKHQMHLSIKYNSKLEEESNCKRKISINLIHKLLLLFPWVLNSVMRMLKYCNHLKIVNHIYYLHNINLLNFNSNLPLQEIWNNSNSFHKCKHNNNLNKLLNHLPLFHLLWYHKTHKKLSIIQIHLFFKRS